MHTAELLDIATRQLSVSDSPRLDAEALLAALLKKDRSWFYAHPAAPVDAATVTHYRRLLRARQRGCPVAYLTGSKAFHSITLRVDRHTLIPRPETELLVELALQRIPPGSRQRLLDLGAGSGAIAIALARARPACAVTAVDLSAKALKVARHNVAATGTTNVAITRSNWFDKLHGQRFDAVLCNPPYVDFAGASAASNVIRHEPRLALDGGYRGEACLRAVIADAPRHIARRGFIILEHGCNQGEFVRQQLRANRYRNVTTHSDYAGHERHSMALGPC